MTLRAFIEKVGPKNIATHLKVDPSTVAQWKRGAAVPRPGKMLQINKMSKGQVTIESMLRLKKSKKLKAKK